MMAQSRTESTWDTYNYGKYINQFPPNTIKAIWPYERIKKNICRQKMSIMFNEICLYIYIYIYIYTIVSQKEEHKIFAVAIQYHINKIKTSSGSSHRVKWFHVLLCNKHFNICTVGRGNKIHRLHLCRWVRPLTNKCPGYITKQSDGEVTEMLELQGMQSTPSLPSLPGQLGVVAIDRVLYMCQMELNCVLMPNWITWNRTVLTINCVCFKTILILNWIVWIRTFDQTE